MSKATIQFEPARAGAPPAVVVRLLDRALIGHDAELRICAKAHVHDSRAVHCEKEVFKRSLKLASTDTRIELPPASLQGFYSYRGAHIDVRLVTRLKVDDGVLFDTSVDGTLDLPVGDRPQTAEPESLVEPKDVFSFFDNLNAIPPQNRVITLGLAIVGGIVVLLNMALGIHDEFAMQGGAWFYSHGEDAGPIEKALSGSGAAGVAIWLAIRAQLRKYMRFALKPLPGLRRGTRVPMRELVEGEARVPLEGITVRVVACNKECGQYKRGSGTKVRTVSFRTPSRAVKLYEKQLARVPAGVPLGNYLDGEVNFDAMFSALYPPLQVGSSHGIDVCWEVQLIHPKFVDQELEGDAKGLKYEDFLHA